MQMADAISLSDVRKVYSGPEGKLWELIMGEQIHIGGLQSSKELAERAGIAAGTRGVDLCCATGAGMRFLLRWRGVGHMTGVDATPAMIEAGRERCRDEGRGDSVDFIMAEAVATGLPAGGADFVWGEDAWCYVADKPALIAEAARIVRQGGTIAFTDWVEMGEGISPAEAGRFLGFMKFPNLASIEDYRAMLKGAGCRVEAASDTGRFAPAIDLYLAMLDRQLTYDALKIIGFDETLMRTLAEEMNFIGGLAREGKIGQAMFIARREPS